MAATSSKTMAEALASSPSMQMSSSSNLTNNPPGNSSDYANTGTAVLPVDNCKDENGTTSSNNNIMMKTCSYLTITVYIPTACVGVLIGKRGSNIDSIQKLAAKESTKSHSSSSSRGGSGGGARNNKSAKQNNPKNNNGNNNNSKAVSPESVRISVVNAQHQQHFEQQHFKNNNSHILGETNNNANSSASGQQQQQQQMAGMSSSLMDMQGVPTTYTELDFSDPQWTPIVIRADPIAAVYAATAIHDICCPEYVTDRTQLVYIMDVPVPAVAGGNTTNNNNNANLRHASIVGKRGNKLIQLSADHKCRIMVPPKQLGHNVIQLEAPLKECCSCLRAVVAKLQTGGGYTSGNEEKEQQQFQHQQGDAITKTSPATPPSKNNAKNNTAAGNNKGNKNKNENGKNSFQMTLIIQPLPSQTKLRNIARKTETKILKKRIPKSQQRNQKHQQQQKQEQEQDPELKQQQQPEQSLEETEEAGDPNQEKQEQQGASNNASSNANNNNNNNSDSKVSWRLTVVATSEKKVMKAVDMLKVLNSKGYEVIVEELGANNNYVDTSSKSISEGGLEDDTDVGAWTSESPMNGSGTMDAASKSPSTNNGNNNGRSSGRGGRSKKQRHRNNHRGNNNGKDNKAATGDDNYNNS